MKVPYPDVNAGLAAKAHMYICKHNDNDSYEFVKCQTLKPKMLFNNHFKHFVDEEADISRNPFNHMTRIDCDKVFTTENVQYDETLRTTIRPDVCQELYNEIIEELNEDGYDIIQMNEEELTNINSKINQR